MSKHHVELRRDYGVRSLALFGSAARNETGSESDVDILVEFEKRIGLFQFIRTKQRLEDLLSVKEVDLVMRSAVIPELRGDIYGEAIDVE
ncbi:MAG: nucleotidyltransferase family protein [Pseudomonadota bacterium]